MIAPRKLRIGDVLIESGLLTQDQLDRALDTQKDRGGKLGDLIIQLGFLTESEFLRALSNQLGIPFIDLDHYNIDINVASGLAEKITRKHKVILLDSSEEDCLVGMSDPTDVFALDEIKHILKKTIRAAVVRETSLLKVLDHIYRRTDDIATFAEELSEEMRFESLDDEDLDSHSAQSAPVAKLLESIFEDAIQVGASDIHIEPDEKILRIRVRVDGILQEDILNDKKIVNALVLRIKLISKMNISERRLPQDGRFRLNIRGRDIDVRVSTMPIRHGESVVMRLLDQSRSMLSLTQINLRADIAEKIKYHITRPNGLFIVTGPTGSGKTTTLYSILTELNDKEKKIITIEDPVEYTLPRINQVQTNADIGLTFARVLRTALRQDPEIVMIGEMRDQETATIGLRAALTGHFVLSTLHTNDSISSAMRLIDMGAEAYLVAAALRCVVAQRLVRVICDNCKEETSPSENENKLLSMMVGEIPSDWKFHHGIGCQSCGGSGYKGRIGIHEMLEMNSELADILRTGDANAFGHAVLKQKTFKPLSIAALDYVLEGVTTLEEVFRIAGEIEGVKKD